MKKQSHLYQERNMHRSNTIYQQNEDNRGWMFSLEDVLWIMDSYFGSFSLHKMSIDGLEWCGLLVDFCAVFISCLDSHSDGTHSLQRIHWWTSDVMLHFPWRNKLIYILDSLRVSKFSANFHFWVNYSFNGQHKMACTIHFIFIIWHILE